MQCITSTTLNQIPLGALEALGLGLLRCLGTLLVVLNLGARIIHRLNRRRLLGCPRGATHWKGATPLCLGTIVSHAVRMTLAIHSQHFWTRFTFLVLLSPHIAA